MNIYVNKIGVPRKARNKRIYAGVSFNSTNSYQSSELANQRHIEAGRLTGLTSHSVSVEFAEPFEIIPTGMSIVTVTRLVYESSMDAYIRQGVLHYFPNGTTIVGTTGFNLTIDSSESLTGVIIEYIFL